MLTVDIAKAVLLTSGQIWITLSPVLSVDKKKYPMASSERIKPVSYLKSHASEIVGSLAEEGEPLVITQDGEAKAVILGYDSYERTLQTLALLKVLALGNKQIEEGKVVTADQAIRQLRKRREATY